MIGTAIFIVTYRAANGLGYRRELALPANYHLAKRAAATEIDRHHVVIPGTLAVQQRRR